MIPESVCTNSAVAITMISLDGTVPIPAVRMSIKGDFLRQVAMLPKLYYVRINEMKLTTSKNRED